MKDKYTALEMEVEIANYFSPRVNLIVPNISWGMWLHECDLLVITPSNYAYEVEIKTDKYDLIKDAQKRHKHNSDKIKKLYFGIPYYLQDYINHIPERAGIIVVGTSLYCRNNVKKTREAQVCGDYKFSDEERYNVARLGSMRIWGLKKALNELKEAKK